MVTYFGRGYILEYPAKCVTIYILKTSLLMKRYLLTVAFILSALFTNGQTIRHDDAQQILSDVLMAQKALQGAVIFSDIKGNDIASADCRMTKRGLKPCKQDFMNVVAEKSKQFSHDDCRADYAELKGLNIAAKGATVKADRKRHYWGSLTAYYPADNPQYRIFVIMEQDMRNGTYYGVPLCTPVVARMIETIDSKYYINSQP